MVYYSKENTKYLKKIGVADNLQGIRDYYDSWATQFGGTPSNGVDIGIVVDAVKNFVTYLPAVRYAAATPDAGWPPMPGVDHHYNIATLMQMAPNYRPIEQANDRYNYLVAHPLPVNAVVEVQEDADDDHVDFITFSPETNGVREIKLTRREVKLISEVEDSHNLVAVIEALQLMGRTSNAADDADDADDAGAAPAGPGGQALSPAGTQAAKTLHDIRDHDSGLASAQAALRQATSADLSK